MRRILVTGRGGQLATGLLDSLPAFGFEPLALGRPAFDFDRPETVRAAFAAASPDAVVNCAAWTAVDAAEDDEAAAFRANALGPALLAELCRAARVPLLHISTDYVHDGQKGAPYRETDAPHPLGAYGRTKLAGDWAALAGNPMTCILRTAWVFSPVGRNFVRTMLAAGAARPVLRVVADQHGHPTAAPDLADTIATILQRIRDTGWQDSFHGVFHAAGSGSTTWHGLAEAVFDAARLHGGPSPQVTAIRTAEYPMKAVRPVDGRLDQAKLQAVFGISMPPWQDGLARVIRALHPSA